VIDRLERAGFAQRERAEVDRRKVMVRTLPAACHIFPLLRPMERTAMAALAGQEGRGARLPPWRSLTRLREAATAAMTELCAQPKATDKARKAAKRRAAHADQLPHHRDRSPDMR